MAAIDRQSRPWPAPTEPCVGWVETALSSKPNMGGVGALLGFASLNPTYGVQLLRQIVGKWQPSK
jgi:hypothetical protein